ncbi:MAG: response regulator [Anaerolineae bacterium]
MKKILIVEDNAMNRALLMAILKPEGYGLMTAENGQLGVDAATRDLPDLILMDVMLPVMNMATTPPARSKPIRQPVTSRLAITAESRLPTERDRHVRIAGCDGYHQTGRYTRALPNQVRLFIR